MQDMPPPGGFGQIAVERTLPKPIVRQSFVLAFCVGMTLFGAEWLRHFRRRHRILRMEQQEHYIATLPFLYAEQERKYLINLHKIREYERELMKDHPGWVVGTLYGEKVFKTLPSEYLPYTSPNEFMLGRPFNDWFYKVVNIDFWH